MSMCQKLAASILFLLCGISVVFGQGSYTGFVAQGGLGACF